MGLGASSANYSQQASMIPVVSDRLGRPLKDLRISLTDRCNLRCTYCMPEEFFGPNFRFLPSDQLLSPAAIELLVRGFVQAGVEKVRLTGGEPLLRPEIVEITERISGIPDIKDLALTTNATRLPAKAVPLRNAGLHRINVSLDAVEERLFHEMTGRRLPVNHVLEGLDAALAAGLSVKLNSVIRRGVNESQILPLVQEATKRGIGIRFIEYMDVGNQNAWTEADVVKGSEILEVLKHHYEIEPIKDSIVGLVARRYRILGAGIELGLIDSVSQPFCRGCTRARVSATGTLYKCLFGTSGTDLKPYLTYNDNGDIRLTEYIEKLWGIRDDRYSELRRELSKSARGKKPEMWEIGG